MTALYQHSYSCLRRKRKYKSAHRNYICILCPYQCRRPHRLREHFRVHTKEKPYSCTMCNYQSAASYAVNRHMISAHLAVAPNKDKKFRCTMCNFQSKFLSQMSAHMQKSHISNLQEEPRVFTCVHCGHVTITMEDMKMHNEAVHLNLQTANDRIDTKDTKLRDLILDEHIFASKNAEDSNSSLKCQVFQNSMNEWKSGDTGPPISEDIKYPICELNSEGAKDSSCKLNSEDIRNPMCELNSEGSKELISELTFEDMKYPIYKLNSDSATDTFIEINTELDKENTLQVKEEIISLD